MTDILIYGGAHLGEATQWFIDHPSMPPGSQIIYYDPHPGSGLPDDLRATLSAREIGWEWRHQALWTVPASMIFRYVSADINERGNMAGSLRAVKTRRKKLAYQRTLSVKVEAVSLVDVIASLPDGRLTVKLDVEGAEYPICRQLLATDAIRRIARLCIEWHYKLIRTENESTTCELQWQLAERTALLPWGIHNEL